jgi:hypothetical protein
MSFKIARTKLPQCAMPCGGQATGITELAESHPTSLFEDLLIDGHVHVHDSYNEAAFLASAYANLSRQGAGTPTLLLAEMPGQQVFAKWRRGDAPCRVSVTRELSSIVLEGGLLVIAGRQITTAERIEVLAIACIEPIADGLTLNATIAAIRDAGALPVLPWGVGKWSGERGRLIVNAAERYNVLLGDNAGRPLGWPRPALFKQHVVLPGTDPLRLRSDQERVGTYGFVLKGRFDSDRPTGAMVTALQKLTQSPPSFGHRVTPFVFLQQQSGLRFSR